MNFCLFEPTVYISVLFKTAIELAGAARLMHMFINMTSQNLKHYVTMKLFYTVFRK